jgi:hypothetical protein
MFSPSPLSVAISLALDIEPLPVLSDCGFVQFVICECCGHVYPTLF